MQEVRDVLDTFRERQAAAAAEAMTQWEAANVRAVALEEQQLKALEFQVKQVNLKQVFIRDNPLHLAILLHR